MSKEVYPTLPKLPLPFYSPRTDPMAYFCTEEITWSEEVPHLIAHATFSYSRSAVLEAWDSPFLNNGVKINGDRKYMQQVVKSIPDHLKAGDCSVLQWTNTSYGKFPKEFEFRAYNTLTDYITTRELMLLGKAHGVVRSITSREKVSTTPPLTRDITTYDFRFSNPKKGIASIRYGKPVDHWLTNISDVDLGVAVFNKILPQNQPTRTSSIRMIQIALVIVLIIPLFFAIRRVRNKSK